MLLTLSGTDLNGNPINRTASTDANGTYTFTELLQVTYTVTEAQPNGYTDGQDKLGNSGGTLGNEW